MSSAVNTPSSTSNAGDDPNPIDVDPDSPSLLDFRPEEIHIFLRYQRQALDDCTRRIVEQEAILFAYNGLRSRLLTLSDLTRYPAVIPLGPHAVVRGELVHTNEVLVFLGSDYFVERSSKQACDIAARRINLVERNLTKLTEERKNIQSKMDMLTNMVQQQSLDEIVEIREKLDEPTSPGDARRIEREKPATDEEELLKRLDQLHDEEELANNSIDVDAEYEDSGPRRPIPLPSARPRRSSLPALPGGLRKKERKSVSFAPFQGNVPERETKDHPMFKQALQMMFASGKFKTMDEGSQESDEFEFSTVSNHRAMSADSALPRLKKQANVVMESMDIDVDPADLIPMMDSDEITERNVGNTRGETSSSTASSSFESISPTLPDVSPSSSKPVSRFKASRQK